MKSFLKHIILISVAVCYFCSYFEFDETEMNVNYQNESHIYVHTEKQSFVFTFKIVKQPKDNFIINGHIELSAPHFSSGINSGYLLPEPKPPDLNKIYISYCSFLI